MARQRTSVPGASSVAGSLPVRSGRLHRCRPPDPLVGYKLPAAAMPPSAPVAAQPPAVARSPRTCHNVSFFAGLDPLAARGWMCAPPDRGRAAARRTGSDRHDYRFGGSLGFRAGRVEWTLDGPGAIVEVDDRGRLFIRGGKTDDQHAVGVHRAFRSASMIVRAQLPCFHHPTRSKLVRRQRHGGRRYPRDRLTPRKSANGVGQPCRSSFSIGATPRGVWLRRRRRAGRARNSSSARPAVFRRDDHQPLAGYSVARYHILDGPAALFLPAQAAETIVVSNSTGAAPVVVSQTTALAGRTRIGFEVLRAGDVVIGHGETYADWQGANVSADRAVASHRDDRPGDALHTRRQQRRCRGRALSDGSHPHSRRMQANPHRTAGESAGPGVDMDARRGERPQPAIASSDLPVGSGRHDHGAQSQGHDD